MTQMYLLPNDSSLSANDYTVLNDAFKPPNLNQIEAKTKKAIDYLYYFTEPYEILKDARAQNALMFLGYVESQNNAQEPLKYDHLPKLFANLCKYFLENIEVFQDDIKIVEIFKSIFNIIKNGTDRSRAFCLDFHYFGGTIALIACLNNDRLIKKTAETRTNRVIFEALVKDILSSLFHIITKNDDSISSLHEIRGDILLDKFIRNSKIFESRVIACMSLVNIINDSEIESSTVIKFTLKEIAKLIKIMSIAIEEKSDLKRKRFSFDTDLIEADGEVCFIEQYGISWNLAELFITLNNISVNDKMKIEIYEIIDVEQDLEKIINYGNETEKLYATRLIWQLCFDKHIANKVGMVSKLFVTLDNISKQGTFKGSALKKYYDGIVWSVSKGDRKNSKVDSKPIGSPVTHRRTHIMISYNSKSRETCLKIKNDLESSGYKVWIDVEHIHGSSLEAMAKAIEQSKCVLMCMTEKYKQSPNCRAEAEYAFKLNTPIIPLKLEKYDPDGWLGLILGSKIYVDFTKQSFEESMKFLKNQIVLVTQEASEVNNEDEKKSISGREKKSRDTDIATQKLKLKGYYNSANNLSVDQQSTSLVTNHYFDNQKKNNISVEEFGKKIDERYRKNSEVFTNFIQQTKDLVQQKAQDEHVSVKIGQDRNTPVNVIPAPQYPLVVYPPVYQQGFQQNPYPYANVHSYRTVQYGVPYVMNPPLQQPVGFATQFYALSQQQQNEKNDGLAAAKDKLLNFLKIKN